MRDGRSDVDAGAGAGEAALRRALSLPVLTFYGLGTIIGAGIYVLVGEVAGIAGMYAPVSFLLAAVAAALTAFAYAELASRFPRSAGEAVYVQEGMGIRGLSVAVGLAIVASAMVSSATIANGFVGYLNVFVEVPRMAAVAGLVLGLGLLAAWGIREAAWAAVAVTLVEIGGLVWIIAAASPALATLPGRLPELVPPLQVAAWHGIALGAFLAFYAFIGFEDMVNVAEEVHEPSRTMPRAVLLATGGAAVLYVLVALTAVLAVPPAELAASGAPLALLYARATGADPVLISVISVFAVVNGALIQLIMGSRALYGMARQGWLPAALGVVNRHTRTPLRTTALMTVAVLTLALALPLVTLAKATSFVVLCVFALVNLALVRVKRRGPPPAGIYSCPAWIPPAGFLLSVALLAVQSAQLFAG